MASVTLKNTKAELFAEVQRLQALLAAASAVAAPIVRRPNQPQWQVDRAIAMASARQQAMSLNSVVKV
jgi:hypothetical protein